MSLGNARVLIFDSKLRDNFHPLCLTRPAFELQCGSKSLIASVEEKLGTKVSHAIVPKYLQAVCSENHPDIRVNEEIAEPCIVVSSLVNPLLNLEKILQRYSTQLGKNFLLTEKGEPLIGLLNSFKIELLSASPSKSESFIRQEIDSSISYDSLIRYPWQLLAVSGSAIRSLPTKSKTDPKTASGSFAKTGKDVRISGTATIEDYVRFDSDDGPIIIDDEATIQSFTRIVGPTYIGKRTVVRSGSVVARSSIANDCRIGGELEDSIINEYSNKAHQGYVGHSVVGSWVNLGALTTVSNLKNTYGTIKVKIQGQTLNTNLVKVGAFLGDMVKTSIGTLIYSGRRIGASCHLFGSIAEDVPAFTICRSENKRLQQAELYVESAIETQRRMMARRGIQMSNAIAEMIKSVHFATAKDRQAAGVVREKFALS